MPPEIVPEQRKPWTPGETIASALGALAVVGAARAWSGSAELWHYGAGALSILLVAVGVWGWVRGRKR